MSRDLVTVVLVEPNNSLNVGSAARAMSNLGYARLTLVTPRGYSSEKASVTACWAADVLQSARITSSVAEAVADEEDVVAFSPRRDRTYMAEEELFEWARAWRESPRRTALLFGPEDTGLRAEHLDHARVAVSLPTAEANPSLNLSHAVLMALFELSREPPKATPRERAEWRQVAVLEDLVSALAERSGFYTKGTPAVVKRLVRNLVRRLAPTQREMQILLGFFGRLEKANRRVGN